MKALATRAAFVAGAAVVAAGLADPLVEGLSNAGAFGSGTFTDGSNADVVPALALGAVLCAVFVLLGVRRLLCEAPAAHARSRAPLGLGAIAPLRLLSWIFPLQLGVLYALETLEQRVAVGHVFGGTVWLGGPVWASLCVHFAAAIGVTTILGRLLRAATKRVADAIRCAAGGYARIEAACVAAFFAPAAIPVPTAPRGSRLKGRAPPRFLR